MLSSTMGAQPSCPTEIELSAVKSFITEPTLVRGESVVSVANGNVSPADVSMIGGQGVCIYQGS
jgi:hypothetical protein